MTTPQATESTRASVAQAPSPSALRDVCMRIQLLSPLTDEELERVNRLNPGWKFEIGPNAELEATMIAGGVSAEIGSELNRQLGNWRVAGGGGRLRDSDGTYKLTHPELGDRTRAPDVSWASGDLLEATPRTNRPARGFWSLCPTFVIEVRSSSDSLRVQQKRMEEWLQFGVEAGWLVDPLEYRVWIYRIDEAVESLGRPAALSGEPLLAGLVVDLTEVWTFADELAEISDDNA